MKLLYNVLINLLSNFADQFVLCGQPAKLNKGCYHMTLKTTLRLHNLLLISHVMVFYTTLVSYSQTLIQQHTHVNDSAVSIFHKIFKYY